MKRPLLLLAALSVLTPAVAGWDGRAWNDGRAEVAVYDCQLVVDGKIREFRDTLLTSREDDGRAKVFKFNTAQSFQGANQPVSLLTSVIADAGNVEKIVRLAVGAQDWGGSVSKSFVAGQLTQTSWRAGEGEKAVPLDVQPGDLFEDALPLTLRALPFKEGFFIKARLWETMASTAVGEPKAVPVVVRIVGEDTVRGRAGSIPSWKVAVERDGGATDYYWFEKKDPRVLTRMDRSDGLKRVLYGRARWSYWDKRLPRPNVLN